MKNSPQILKKVNNSGSSLLQTVTQPRKGQVNEEEN